MSADYPSPSRSESQSVGPAEFDHLSPTDETAAILSRLPMRKAALPEGAVAVTMAQAMQSLGLSREMLAVLIGAGKLDSIKVGGRTLITTKSFRSLVPPLA